MLCAWSSQYPHRPILPDESASVTLSNLPHLRELHAGQWFV
jgi:hypothetical protein